MNIQKGAKAIETKVQQENLIAKETRHLSHFGSLSSHHTPQKPKYTE